MFLSKKSNKLIAVASFLLAIGFQSIDVMARIGGSSRSSGFSSGHNYSNSYSSPTRVGGGNNTGMQRNDVVNAERQKSSAINNQTSAQQPTQAQEQPAPSKFGLGHVAGAAVAGAAVGYMLNSHNNYQPMQNNGGASGQFDGPNNGQPSHSGFPWGTIFMLLLAGLGLLWLYKRSARFQAAGSVIKEVLNPVPVSSSQSNTAFNSQSNTAFNAEHQAFEAEALTFFNALQNANNQGDIAFMTSYSTGDMQDALIGDIKNRTASSNSRFSLMAAKVIDMTTQGSQSIASVRFTGMVAEGNNAFEPMDEVWHLVRQSGEWQLAGIEQM